MLGLAGEGDRPDAARFVPAVIVSVTAGMADDGRALVEVQWGDLVLPVPYLAREYTTSDVGAVVMLGVQGTQVWLVGPVWGTPPDPNPT